jgi:hypothetical protein
MQKTLLRPSHPAVQALIPLKPPALRAFVLREGVAVKRGRYIFVDLAALVQKMTPD